jgi:NADPH:quinone reductase-like Zn-dependent oxidoreductase
MKAILHTAYGSPDVLQLTETAKPVPKDDEVLVRIRAASVNPLDWHFMRGSPVPMRLATGLRKPKDGRLGTDVSGQIEAVGRNVTEFQAGDEVFGTCKGAFAEYACAAEKTLVRKPESVTFEAAAAVPVAALTALQALRDKGHVQPGQKVLINGAAGGVGTFAVELAKSFGAEVTGVCGTRNVAMVRSIGADRVVDYTKEDFTRSGQRHDLMLDMIGNQTLAACRRALTPHGTLVRVGGAAKGLQLLTGILKLVLVAPFISQKLVLLMTHLNQADLTVMQGLLASGKVTPVIDRSYPLSEVAAAIRYLEEGHARGKVVITVSNGGA